MTLLNDTCPLCTVYDVGHIIRPMMDSTDARAVRTRAKLVSAFHEIVEHTDPAAMSVSQLTRTAGVNRTSFYAHFSSPEDVAVQAISDLFEFVSSDDTLLRTTGTSAADAARSAIRRVVEFVDERRASYARLLAPQASPRVRAAIIAAWAANAERAIDHYTALPDDIDAEAAAHFVGAGAVEVIGRWLVEDDPRPAEALIDTLCRNLPAWMTTDAR